jgi:hypothetical protein
LILKEELIRMKTEFDKKLELNKEEVQRHAKEGDEKVIHSQIFNLTIVPICPVVNFTNILRAALAQVSLHQKRLNVLKMHLENAHINGN